jgi:class 3 adenylate cyclase
VNGEAAKRKLAAILSADVVGYSRLMQDDDSATVATLREYRAAITRVIDRHSGRVVNAPGDNMLAEFPSAVEAVQSAAEIQKVLEGRNLELPAERRMEFRIGVNLGDVIEEEDGTIYGDGVNVAARMEALADAGGICISSKVLDEVEGKLDFGFDFLGEQQVKNNDKPVRVYRVRAEARAPKSATSSPNLAEACWGSLLKKGPCRLPGPALTGRAFSRHVLYLCPWGPDARGATQPRHAEC